MSVVKFGKQKKKPAANTGDLKYIEVADGRPFIVDRAVAPDGTPNAQATAENFRKLAPHAAQALRAQGAARRPNTASNASNSEVAAKAVQDERARIRSILALDVARGRERLAEQLALTEGMSAERAAEILRTAPAENPAYAIGADPDEDARRAADRAVQAARGGGFIR